MQKMEGWTHLTNRFIRLIIMIQTTILYLKKQVKIQCVQDVQDVHTMCSGCSGCSGCSECSNYCEMGFKMNSCGCGRAQNSL